MRSYEAFAALFAGTPRGLQARDWLDRHRRMVAWNKRRDPITPRRPIAPSSCCILDSDLTATARKMIERLRYRPDTTPAAALSVPATNVALAGADLSLQRRAAATAAAAEEGRCAGEEEARRARSAAARRQAPPRVVVEDDVVVVRRPPLRVVYEPVGPPIGIGIGIGLGGGGYRGGHGGDGYRRGGY